MRRVLALFSCLLLSACIMSSVDSKRTAASDELQPLRSILVFVESSMAENAKLTEDAMVAKLSEAGIAVQRGTTQLPSTAAVDDVLAKAHALGVDGALIVAVEWINYKRGNANQAPITELLGLDTRRFSPRASYGARAFDVRTQGKRAKLWQAKIDLSGNSYTTTEEVLESVARQIVGELRSEDIIAAAR